MTANRFRPQLHALEDRDVPAGVVTYQVNSLVDAPYDHRSAGVGVNGDNAPAGTPVDAAGWATLRAIIDYADQNPRTGNLQQNSYSVDFTPVSGGTIVLDPDEGTLELDSNVQFGGVPVTIQRGAGVAAFGLFEVAQNVQCSFLNMTLTGGNSPMNGGAILIDAGATVTVSGCTLTQNQAGASGGAIATLAPSEEGVLGASLSISNSTLNTNTAAFEGGAIWADTARVLSIAGSTITGNTVTSNQAGEGLGGGVAADRTANVSISNTTISNNTAGTYGGGLYVHDDIGGITGLVVSNSTLNNNTAATNGGGFYVDVLDDNANFTSVTVTNNTATNGKGGGGYLKNGNLNGSLQALTGNKDANGVNGKYAGVTYALAATCTLTAPENQQTVVQDNQ
jgi:predicted outer membrane repeat protein